jgi:hypothetical protein
MKGSALGILIVLYEHRSDHGATTESEDAQGDDGHGGARTIASSSLKWLLRFVNALVDGATSIGARVLKCELFSKRTTAITLSSCCCCWCSLFLFFSFAK